MPFNGSGTYSAPSLPGTWNPAQSGSSIDPTDWNTLLTDLATAMTKQVCADGQTTISANIPFATHRITGLGDPSGLQDAATKNYVDGSAVWSALGGLQTSRASATTLTVAAGKCTDSTNLIGISLASAMTKSTAGAWASGNNSNGMGNGLTIANTTWYHVFAIINTGAADVYFDTSVTAANKPTSTTAFRRVGSFLTNGSAQIIDFIQAGDRFFWTAGPVLDVNVLSSGTSAVTRTLTVPTGVVVEPIMSITLDSDGNGETVYLSALSTTDVAAGGTTAQVGITVTGTVSAQQGMGFVQGVITNTSAQIRSRQSFGAAAQRLRIKTHGWIDRRGRDD